ncbi:hypothetical protein F2P81_013615 [Scophthalmus maximus]|uniref:Uncharacterized protein n=1 Tax=Scophthalmus maximus TaxID=52904 RepID=A0A6A4SLQ3_SCOMX|nr:hypothetical protein F2P81_013615 [Scophthalmus maximus]
MEKARNVEETKVIPRQLSALTLYRCEQSVLDYCHAHLSLQLNVGMEPKTQELGGRSLARAATLDVSTQWNSLYLMLERFLEQYSAVQTANLDQRLRKNMEKDRLARCEDFRKAEDFINLMRLLYISTLCVSTEKNPTFGQILPILKKLERHFTVVEGEPVFVSNLKKQVWANLSKRFRK